MKAGLLRPALWFVCRQQVGALLSALLLTLSLALPVQAAPGDLDPSFGGGTGRVITDFGGLFDEAHAVALQPDGKIVAAGFSSFSDTVGGDFAVARYNPDGSLDPTFGVGGKVTTDFGGTDRAFALALQPDGKLVVGGFSDATGGGDFAVARYNANGSLDPTFGLGGKVTTDFGGTDRAFALALQSDGKLVVAGFSDVTGGGDFALARYNANGSLDPTFGLGGKVTTNFGALEQAQALVLQSDGKLVVGGFSNAAGTFDFALARYNANGSLDPTFGLGGKVTTDFGSFEQAQALVLQSNGRLVVAGFSNATGSIDFALARYNPDGSLDPTFGLGGKVTTDFGGVDLAFGLALQPDGRPVVAGFSNATGPWDHFALARYNPDGSLDPTFGVGGKVTTNDFSGQGFAIAVQLNGKPLVVGWSNVGGTLDFAVARYQGDVADLALTKTDSPDPVKVGANLTYTITITNNGPSAATGVTVTDVLPGSVTFVSASPSQGSCTGTSIVICSLGSLASGASATVTIVVAPTVTGPITNAAGVTAAQFDPNLANNTASQGTMVNPADAIPPSTTATPSPGPNANDWNKTDVTVTLNASDNPGGTGVKEIQFFLAGAQGGAGLVSGNVASVSFTVEGITTLTYFARDNAGNQESAKTLTVRIDKTKPELALRCGPTGPESGDLVVSGIDTGSDNASVTLTAVVPIGGEFRELRTYTIKDNADNSLVADVAFRQAGNAMRASIWSLSYNGGAPIAFAQGSNLLKCSWTIEPGVALTGLNQNLEIRTPNNLRVTTATLFFLKLITNQGNLSFGF